MSGDSKRGDEAALLRFQLNRGESFRHGGVATHNATSPERLMLAAWQSARLARTYTDLSRNARYKPAADFFLNELYGPKDFSQRDRDMERVAPLMVKVMPQHVIHTLAQAMEMDALAQELDANLLEVLLNDFGVTDHISEEVFAQAYRQCDNYDTRKHQIRLIEILGKDLDSIVAKPFVYAALRMARKPAHMAGLGELQEFLERGFSAFKRMKGAKEFLHTIVSRETYILDQIYAGNPAPFELPPDLAPKA